MTLSAKAAVATTAAAINATVKMRDTLRNELDNGILHSLGSMQTGWM